MNFVTLKLKTLYYLNKETASVQAHEEEHKEIPELVGPPKPLEHLLAAVRKREYVPEIINKDLTSLRAIIVFFKASLAKL